MRWQATCRTCGLAYEDPHGVVCPNPFHCCRECTWEDGVRVSVCVGCKAQEEALQGVLSAPLPRVHKRWPRR